MSSVMVVSLANSYSFRIRQVCRARLRLLILFTLMYGILPLLFLRVEIDIMFCLWMITRVLHGFTLCITAVSYFLTIAPL